MACQPFSPSRPQVLPEYLGHSVDQVLCFLDSDDGLGSRVSGYHREQWEMMMIIVIIIFYYSYLITCYHIPLRFCSLIMVNRYTILVDCYYCKKICVVNLCICVSIMMTSKASQLGPRGFANFPVSAELKAALEEMVTQRDSAWGANMGKFTNQHGGCGILHLIGGLEHNFNDFPYIGNVIIPTDAKHIFQRGCGRPPTSHV